MSVEGAAAELCLTTTAGAYRSAGSHGALRLGRVTARQGWFRGPEMVRLVVAGAEKGQPTRDASGYSSSRSTGARVRPSRRRPPFRLDLRCHMLVHKRPSDCAKTLWPALVSAGFP